ncbi:MAG: hypothetical protein U0271_38180 [Polyangiaceae bacterium]
MSPIVLNAALRSAITARTSLFFAALLPLVACSSTASTQASSSPQASASADTSGPPTCFFDGDVSSAVHATITPKDGGQVLTVTWDSERPAGARWLPPERITTVELSLGIECGGPLATPGVQATVTGPRTVQLTMPRAFIDGLAQSCPSRAVVVPLVLEGLSYGSKCKNPLGDGLPFHVLRVPLTLGENGAATIGPIQGTQYSEG